MFRFWTKHNEQASKHSAKVKNCTTQLYCVYFEVSKRKHWTAFLNKPLRYPTFLAWEPSLLVKTETNLSNLFFP